jgi:hypothetical protein
MLPLVDSQRKGSVDTPPAPTYPARWRKGGEGWIMKKRLALAMVVLAPTVSAVAFVRPGGSITVDQYQKIEVGLSRRTVEEILGGPANGSGVMWACTTSWSGAPLAIPEEWRGPDIIVWVWFDARGRVETSDYQAWYRPAKTPSLWDKACSWLPWSPSTAPN